MQILKKNSAVKKAVKEAQENNKKIALIPTMGALHQGHLSLIKEAKKHCDFVILSIFVNKTQFNDKTDYQKYPKNLEEDIKKLAKENVDAVFVPNNDEIYENDVDFEINPLKYSDCLCHKFRKNHFQGVCLVITKLFNIVNPDFAIFGKKDFQQFLIIKNLTKQLNFDIKIIGAETVREKSGLAMSSRNSLLNQEEKIKAQNIFKILNEIKKEAKNAGNLEKILQNKEKEFLKIGFQKIDYLEIRDEENLEIAKKIEKNKKYRIFIALYLNQVRLIDNLKI